MDVHMQQIKKIEGGACCSLRPLWEEVFFEDTRLFNDYYFENKAEKNTALVLEDDGQDLAMLYLTPYRLCMKTGGSCRLVESDYVVGVATREKWRHRGYMGRLLKEACLERYGRERPFLYLMPASPAIYEPFQFSYIYDKPRWRLQTDLALKVYSLLEGEARAAEAVRYERKILQAAEDVREEKLQGGSGALEIRPLEEEDIPGLADFASAQLERRYQLYTQRSEDYFRLAMKEMYAQQGDIFLLLDEGTIVGYFFYGREKEAEIQEAMVLPEYEELLMEQAPECRPAIMGRIVHLPAMLSLIQSRQRMEILLQYTDPLIEMNNGFYCWKAGPEESTVQKLPEADVCGKLYAETSPERLCAFLFGRAPADKCFTFKGSYLWEKMGLLRSLEQVKTLRDICINEIV